MEIKTYLSEQRQLVEEHLGLLMLEPTGDFAAHIDAMRYSLFVGGKRVRPILCLAAARAVRDDDAVWKKALPVACALECIHTYSLIHDDLPAMDDDDLRRGKPTNHTVYGEAAAILAGDGLLTYAFELLSGTRLAAIPESARLDIINAMATAAGSTGMVGGQSLDMAYEGQAIPYELLKTIHKSKTGALITASVTTGSIVAGADNEQKSKLKKYGDNIGLAFQIVDDLLDIESTTEELGKPVGSDVACEKATYPALFGVEKSKTMARQAVDNAVDALSAFNQQADPLRALAQYIVERKK